MSSAQGLRFVLLLALGPPAVVVLRTVINPDYLVETSNTLLLVYVMLYAFAITKVVLPFFTTPLRALPQPPGGSFIAGHAQAETKTPRGSLFREWVDTVQNSGLIFFWGLFYANKRVLLTTPEALQEVLVSKCYDFEKPLPGRVLLSRTIGQGLITVEGAEHKHQRKSVTPAFSGKHIKELIPLFWSKSQDFVNAISKQLDISHSSASEKQERSGVVEINQWASRVTLDIIGVACVGRDFNALNSSDDEFVHHYEKILKTDRGVLFALLSILLPLHIARWTPFYTLFREASEGRYQLRPLCRRLIDIKRRDMATESEKHIDILSVLMRPGQLSDDQLVDQLLTFLAAGHETTSGALTWTAWLLATKSDIQEKLRLELREHFENNEPGLTATFLEALPYLNAVTNEQLRLIPTVPTTARVAIRDTTILDQRIPKGTTMILSPWAINRSKALWGPDAEEYKPERWLPEGQAGLGGSKGMFSLITFLHGPRSCIGQAFSRAELKCLIAALVLKFDFQMADPNEIVEPSGMITIKPRHGLRLRVREL
nr:cytochrome p450 3a16 [Quercus suber]